MTVARIPERKADELVRHRVRSGNIIFPRRGEISKCALIREDQAGFICGTGCIKIELPEKYSSKFLYYYLGLPSVVQWLVNHAIGTTMLNLNSLILGRIGIPDIDLNEQARISESLSVYDDLIENNTRQIQLLEEVARQLYKEWFVRLRFPGHEQVKVVNGVPEGWVKKIFDAVCASIGGGTPSTVNRDYWDGDIEWVTPSDITGSKSIYLVVTEKKITESGLRNSSAKMLPESAILMTSRASVGFFAIANRPVCTNQGFISIVPNDDFSRDYLLFNLMSRVDELRARASGTTFKEISRGKFRELSVLWPHESLQTEFGDWVRPILGQIQSLSLMNKKLRQARDLLLPRLMSGEIRV